MSALQSFYRIELKKRKNIERKIEYGFVPVISFIALGIALLLSALYWFFKK